MSKTIEEARQRVVDLARNLRGAERGRAAGRGRLPSTEGNELDAAIAALDVLETPVRYEFFGFLVERLASRSATVFVSHGGPSEFADTVRVESKSLLAAVNGRGMCGNVRYHITITEQRE